MKDPGDIIVYNQLIQKNRLYQFLAGIHQTFDKDRRDLLLLYTLPTVGEAYASIRREVLRRGIMKTEPSSDLESPGSGGVFTAKGRTYRREDDKSHLKCTYCGGTRHTRNECFKLVGYPEWWPDTKKKGEKKPTHFSDHNRAGRAAVGWSNDDPPSMEEKEKQGAAMTSTDIEGGGRDLLSIRNDAQTEQEEERLGLRGGGRENEASQPFIKGRGPRVFFRHNPNPTIFLPLLICHPFVKKGGFLIVGPQIQCHLTRMIF